MEQLTVDKLLQFCIKEHQKGNGKRKIVISDDNEGNGFHGLFYSFTLPEETDIENTIIYDTQESNFDNLIILG